MMECDCENYKILLILIQTEEGWKVDIWYKRQGHPINPKILRIKVKKKRQREMHYLSPNQIKPNYILEKFLFASFRIQI